MTTRLTKQIDGSYVTQTTGACEQPILTFQECFHAAAATLGTGGHNFINQTGSDAQRPAGCSVSVDSKSPQKIHVFFNKISTSPVKCAAGAQTIQGTSHSLVDVSVSLDAAS